MKDLQSTPIGHRTASNGLLHYAIKDRAGQRNEFAGISSLVSREIQSEHRS